MIAGQYSCFYRLMCGADGAPKARREPASVAGRLPLDGWVWSHVVHLKLKNGKEPSNGEDSAKQHCGKKYVLACAKHVAVRLARPFHFSLTLPGWFAQRKDKTAQNDIAEECEAMNQNVAEASCTFDAAGEEPTVEPRHAKPQDPEDRPSDLAVREAEALRRLVRRCLAHGAQRSRSGARRSFLRQAPCIAGLGRIGFGHPTCKQAGKH